MALSPTFGSIKPSQKQQILESNYLNFTDGSGNDFAQQYLPEIYEQEVERYGNRTLSGFLRMVGAEMPMTSDQVVWSEQNRLHVAYEGVTVATATTLTFALGGSGSTFVDNVISKDQTIVVLDPANGREVTAIVTGVSNTASEATLTVATYTGGDLSDTFDVLDAGLKIFVYGSEFAKGTGDADLVSITPSFTQFANSPIIIKSKYAISGSDTAQIGWVEVATEDGTGGYLWYLKAESETRLRFEDYLEMSVVEGTLAETNSGADTAGKKGTEGLFAAVKSRGNVYSGFAPASGELT
ncbi:MAG: hypothetical protein ACR2M9_03505 [Cyanophyceae cyanobacterium]